MPTFLLALLLATTPARPELWRFPGEGGEALRLSLEKAPNSLPPHHLVTEQALDAHLAALTWPADLGCLADDTLCTDPLAGVLESAGLAARIDATSERQDGRYLVTLTRTPAGRGPIQVFRGAGDTLVDAAVAAAAALQGLGLLELRVTPREATLTLDGAPLGKGPGRYNAAPGRHTLRAEAPGFVPLALEVEAQADRIDLVTLTLVKDQAELVFELDPKDAKVLVDGKPVEKPALVSPGSHTLRVEAEGFEPYEQVIEARSNTKLTLRLTLARQGSAWLKAFETPHPDTLAHNSYLRGTLRLRSIKSGDVDAARGRGEDRIKVQTQEDATGQVAFDLGVGLRLDDHAFVEPLVLSWSGGGGVVEADVENLEGATLDELGRLSARLGTFGVQYPAWRVSPYASAGVVLAWEDFSLTAPTRSAELEHTLFLLGVELGVRYHFSPDYFALMAFESEFWFGERPVVGFLMGVGRALDLPEWL